MQTRKLAAKRLELLISAVPDVRRVGILWDQRLPSGRPELREIEGVARSLNLELVPAAVRAPEDFEPAIRAIMERRAGALIVVPGPIFTEHIDRIVDLTAERHLPAMFSRKEQVEAGGLMSHGTNYSDMYRRAADYVDKI